jgi:hypothetical protein
MYALNAEAINPALIKALILFALRAEKKKKMRFYENNNISQQSS